MQNEHCYVEYCCDVTPDKEDVEATIEFDKNFFGITSTFFPDKGAHGMWRSEGRRIDLIVLCNDLDIDVSEIKRCDSIDEHKEKTNV